MLNKTTGSQSIRAAMQRELANKIADASAFGLNEAQILSRRPTRLSMTLLLRVREENSGSLIKRKSK